jgi:hypothetical protein
LQIEELEDSARRSDAKTQDFAGGDAKAYRLLNQNASIDAENLTKEIISMDFKVPMVNERHHPCDTYIHTYLHLMLYCII